MHHLLPYWLGVVSVMAFGNTVSCFVAPAFLNNKLYTRGGSNITPLFARMYGIWTLTSSGVRLACAFDIHNETVYLLTMGTFVLAFLHFASETFIWRTTALTAGTIAPLLVSSLTFAWMYLAMSSF